MGGAGQGAGMLEVVVVVVVVVLHHSRGYGETNEILLESGKEQEFQKWGAKSNFGPGFFFTFMDQISHGR